MKLKEKLTAMIIAAALSLTAVSGLAFTGNAGADTDKAAMAQTAEAAEQESTGGVWSQYRENTFTGENPDYSIVWKITNNPNDRKGASHTVDTTNNTAVITSNDGAAAGDVLYGLAAVIKNIQPNTKYTLTFKEKTNMTDHASHGVYVNAITLATMSNSTDPDATKDVSTLKSGKLSDLHMSLTDDQDWCDRTIEYVSGEGLHGNNTDKGSGYNRSCGA